MTDRRKSLPMGAALLLLALIVYWPVHRFGFLNYDDQTYVWANPHVQAGLTRASLAYAFSANFGGWSPLVWISFLIDKQLLGAAAGAMHVENVCWHALSGILLWMLLLRMTDRRWRSWIVAALFICHPMHVESVAWIAERKDVLSTSLLIGAMLVYLRYATLPPGRRRRIAYAIMLLLFVLSLMAKSMGVTLPLLLLLLDYWPLRRMRVISPGDRDFRRLLLEKIPIVAAAGIFALIAMATQTAGGATAAAAGLPLLDRIDNAIVCYVIYIVKLAVPTHLAAFYPHPGSRPFNAVFAAGALLAMISWSALRLRFRAPYLIVGWLWFLIALLPVIGLVQIGGQAMADRYSYLPSIGLFIAGVWMIADVLQRCFTTKQSRVVPPRNPQSPGDPSRAAQLVAALLALLVLGTFSALARRQVWYWKDTETLFTHSYEVTGPTPVACYAMGTAAWSRHDLRSAAKYLQMVVDQDPGNYRAQELLGEIWVNTDLDRAIGYYQLAVGLKPMDVEYHIALAAALAGRRDDPDSRSAAIAQLRQVLQLDPKNPQAHAGLADLLSQHGAEQSPRMKTERHR